MKKIAKKGTVWLCLAILLLIIIGLIWIYQEIEKEKEEYIAQGLIRIDYREQNGAMPQDGNLSIREEVYVGYDAVDEAGLYVRLETYNAHIEQCDACADMQKLTVADFEEYLSSERNEDGSLRIYEGYEDIHNYVHWYWKEGGAGDIDDYWDCLEMIVGEYREQNPGVISTNVENMNIEQLQELIKKKNDPDYQINMEIMRG